MRTVTQIIASALAAFAILPASAQQPVSKDGGISPEMLSKISKGYAGTGADKALRNALNTASVATLSENAANMAMPDTEFSDRVKTRGITNQRSSGRCWLFTGLNVLRAQAISGHDLGDFQFSQSYVFFYDMLEKSNLFLQSVIDTREKPMDDQEVDWLFQHPISDGGTWTGVANLVMKYGLVPSEVMPESYSANNTSGWTTHLRTLLRQDGLALREGKRSAKELQAMKTDMLTEIWHVLGLTIGAPPSQFSYKGETYTPKSFYDKYVGQDLNKGYVMLMNDPSREYWKTYEISYDRHLYDGQNWVYVNLPLDRIKEMAIASIRADRAMYFSCDVGKFLNRKKGVADLNNYDYGSLLGVEFTMDKRERILTHASGSSHAMTLIAVNVTPEGTTDRWMVENSWGADSGYKGNIIMTDEWFDNYMFRLVVERRFVPEDILRLADSKPVLLPAWDPMFLDE